MKRESRLPAWSASVVAVGALLALTPPAAGQSATTTASATIQSGASDTGANVIVNILSQTNIVLTVSGPAQAVTSVSVPQALNVGGAGANADVRLPTVVTPFGGAGAIAAPNAVAMSVGGNGPEPRGTGPSDQNNLMLVVIQYN